MGKKDERSSGGSTVENRVYLFKDLAAAFVVEQSDLFAGNEEQRQAALRALADIAHACCVMADSEALDEDEVAHLVKTGPVPAVVDDSDVVLESRDDVTPKKGKKKKNAEKKGGKKGKGNAGKAADDGPVRHKDLPGRRGWGGGHGGG